MIDTRRELLAKPFKESEVEWRIQQSGIDKNGNPWAMALCYVTNRAIMNRLDDVFGIGGWKNEYKQTPSMQGTLCGISCKISDEWVTKWDGAEDTAIEATKGGLSSSMKRSAVQWNIGRYLYLLDTGWVTITDDKTAHKAKVKGKDGKDVWFNWLPPKLPNWALPIEDSQVKLIKDSALATGTHIEDIEAYYKMSGINNMTKEQGVSIIQMLGKKEKLGEKELEAFKKELENK